MHETLKDKSYAFCIAKIKLMKDVTDKAFITVSPVYKVADLQFQVSILKADVVNDMLILKGKYSSSKVNTWDGKSCASMDIRGNCIEVNKALEVMSALTVMSQLMFCAYPWTSI